MYLRGILISQSVYRDKKHQEMRNTVMQKIAILERQQKDTSALRVKEELFALRKQLKLLDVHLAARVIMFAKQRIFDFRDKPGRNLAMVLSEHSKKLGTEMKGWIGPYLGRQLRNERYLRSTLNPHILQVVYLRI